MSLGHSPSIVTDGLVMCLDAANYKSFKGVPATNVLDQITYTQGDYSSALYKYTQGLEAVYIPSIGNVTSKFVDIYNDYSGGSGICCPSLFTFGTNLAVSPSTTYTYSIIYKTSTGYTHPNYMYRYEFTSADVLLGEAGVHNNSDRISLGDGWWFAWGQFTTSPTAAKLNTYLFHYEYATYNRVYVYKAALYSGTYVIPYQHMLGLAETRGATVATGGGWADLSGNSNSGTLVNGPVFSSANGGSIVLDGVDDYVTNSNSSFPMAGNLFADGNESWSVSAWFKFPVSPTQSRTDALNVGNCSYTIVGKSGGIGNLATFTLFVAGASTVHGTNTNKCVATIRGVNTPISDTLLNTNTWHNAVVTWNGSIAYGYLNGSAPTPLTVGTAPLQTTYEVNIGTTASLNTPSTGYHNFEGSIGSVKIYNRALTASEVLQNFSAYRGRFGL